MTTPKLARRSWVPTTAESLVQAIATASDTRSPIELVDEIEELTRWNQRIHDVECVNLNPATNTMSVRAEAAMSSGLGSRTSLGYPGAKYEMGLEAVERIEVLAAELAARVFDATYAEVRVPSGAMANLYAFMACADPGDAIIVPPATIAGHVTHHRPGAAGLYGLEIHEAPIDPERYTLDVARVADLARRVRPRLLTVGSSLNLGHHDVAALRRIADEVGARVLFDAAHLSGPIAGGAWPNPLAEGAHLMTMSTYKSLAGPPAGLIVTHDPQLAERLDQIAFPGLTANFDAGKTAALAITLAEWLAGGTQHARTMLDCAGALADGLARRHVPVHLAAGVATRSHALAIDARRFGGGDATARRLRKANLLTSAIGLPSGPGDGLRIGTNELVRWGATVADMDPLADILDRALMADDPTTLATEASRYRSNFDTVRFALG